MKDLNPDYNGRFSYCSNFCKQHFACLSMWALAWTTLVHWVYYYGYDCNQNFGISTSNRCSLSKAIASQNNVLFTRQSIIKAVHKKIDECLYSSLKPPFFLVIFQFSFSNIDIHTWTQQPPAHYIHSGTPTLDSEPSISLSIRTNNQLWSSVNSASTFLSICNSPLTLCGHKSRMTCNQRTWFIDFIFSLSSKDLTMQVHRNSKQL